MKEKLLNGIKKLRSKAFLEDNSYWDTHMRRERELNKITN